METVMLAGILLGFIVVLAGLEERDRRRQKRHERLVARILGVD
jgi:hypothetical protein